MSKTHLGLPAEQDAGGPPGHEAPRNWYLEGPFASVAQEVTAFDLRVTGKIPRELNGRFLRDGTREFYDHGPGRVGIETLFVPMSAASAEDDGWLITSVIDMPTSTSEVLIFHAQDLLGGPVAKIHIPHRHNTGFHGNWIADAELEQTNGQPQRTQA